VRRRPPREQPAHPAKLDERGLRRNLGAAGDSRIVHILGFFCFLSLRKIAAQSVGEPLFLVGRARLFGLRVIPLWSLLGHA